MPLTDTMPRAIVSGRVRDAAILDAPEARARSDHAPIVLEVSDERR
jgi:endonuclease/exonuclease/phosphatase family metal-dependent hydrolase